MALDLGTLTGFLDLDVSAFDGALGGAADKLKDFGGKGAAIAAGAGLAIGTAVAAGVLGAMNVEAANDKLSAQLGLTQAESARIGKVAGSLYAGAYGSSLAEVNTAVGAVMSSIDGMRNASSADIEALTANALDFATAFDVDVSRAVQVAGTVMKAGLAVDGKEAFDLLVTASQQVPASLREDLLDATEEYGQFFGAMGYSGREAFALLVDASSKGVYGIDKMGDAVKEFTIRATDGSELTAGAYESIGLNAEEMTNKLLAGGDSARGATDQIVAGLLGIKDPGAQAAAAIALFGTPLEDLNVTEIPAFLEQMSMASGELEHVAGAADRMGATLNDNAATNIESFKRQLSTTFVDVVGGAVLPAVNNVAAALATGLGPALDVALGFVVALGGGVQATAAFLSEHTTTTTVLAGVITALLIPTLVSLVVGFVTSGAAAVASAATQGAAWLAMQVRALAYGVVMTGVYALNIAQWVGMAVAATTNAARVVAGWVATGAAAVAAGAVHTAQVAAQVAKWVVLAVAGAATNAAAIAAGWAVTVASAIAAAAAHVAAVATQVAAWVLVGAQSLLAAAKVAAAWLIAMGPIGLVIAAVIGLVALIIANWDTIVEVTERLWNTVKDATAAAWEWIKTAVSAGVDFLVNLFLNFTGPGLIIKHWDTIKNATGAAWDWLKDTVRAGFDFVVGLFTNFTGPGLIVKHWDAIKAATSAAWDAVKSVVSGAITGVTNAIGGLSGIPGKVGEWFNGAKDAAGKALGAMVDVVRGIPGRVTDALGSLGGLLSGAGRSVIDGFINGITSGFKKVRDKLGELTGMLPDWKGPADRDAMILRNAGRLVMGGFEAGLIDKFGDVRRTLGDVTDTIGMQVGGPAFVQQRLGIPASSPTAAAAPTVVIHGNVGYDADELAQRIEARRRDAIAALGVGQLTVNI